MKWIFIFLYHIMGCFPVYASKVAIDHTVEEEFQQKVWQIAPQFKVLERGKYPEDCQSYEGLYKVITMLQNMTSYRDFQNEEGFNNFKLLIQSTFTEGKKSFILGLLSNLLNEFSHSEEFFYQSFLQNYSFGTKQYLDILFDKIAKKEGHYQDMIQNIRNFHFQSNIESVEYAYYKILWTYDQEGRTEQSILDEIQTVLSHNAGARKFYHEMLFLDLYPNYSPDQRVQLLLDYDHQYNAKQVTDKNLAKYVHFILQNGYILTRNTQFCVRTGPYQVLKNLTVQQRFRILRDRATKSRCAQKMINKALINNNLGGFYHPVNKTIISMSDNEGASIENYALDTPLDTKIGMQQQECQQEINNRLTHDEHLRQLYYAKNLNHQIPNFLTQNRNVERVSVENLFQMNEIDHIGCSCLLIALIRDEIPREWSLLRDHSDIYKMVWNKVIRGNKKIQEEICFNTLDDVDSDCDCDDENNEFIEFLKQPKIKSVVFRNNLESITPQFQQDFHTIINQIYKH